MKASPVSRGRKDRSRRTHHASRRTDGWLTLDHIQADGDALQVKLSNGGSGALRTDAVRIHRIAPPAHQTVDAYMLGEASYVEESGIWYSSTKGFQGNSRFTYHRDASAKYTFDDLAPGWYEVSANFLASQYQSDRVLYSITSGDEVTGVTVDQQPGSNGWMPLDTIRVDTENLEVKLSQKGAGTMRTDGIRVRRVAEPAYRTIDDGQDSGYTTTGDWTPSGLLGYRGDSHYTYNGTATYTFDNVPPGPYEVLVNAPGSQYSTNLAEYTVTSGSNEVTAKMDQRSGTDGWQRIETIQAIGGSLEINVKQAGQGGLRADAVRIRPLENFFDTYQRELDDYLGSLIDTPIDPPVSSNDQPTSTTLTDEALVQWLLNEDLALPVVGPFSGSTPSESGDEFPLAEAGLFSDRVVQQAPAWPQENLRGAFMWLNELEGRRAKKQSIGEIAPSQQAVDAWLRLFGESE